MRKIFLSLLFIGLAATSCGKKNTETITEEVVVEGVSTPVTQELSYSIEWTAFKTPQKVGVKGTFDQVSLTGLNTDATSLVDELKGAQFVIVTSSANTGDPARDNTLAMNFFSKMVGNINGFFGDFKDGKVTVHLTANGITTEKEFTYEATENEVKLNGSVDIIEDFKANDAFNALHQACGALHEGKTWTDVSIAVDIKK